MADFIQVDSTVFPSEEKTISVQYDEAYGGAHLYNVKNCLGFTDGATQYDESSQQIQFVQKNEDGTVIPGLQSEQLALILLDRLEKLNAKYPSQHNERQKEGLLIFLEGCRNRVEERMSRGIMGELRS